MSNFGPPNSAPLPSSFDENADFYNENTLDKIWRRFREEPLIPLGCGLTAWAIVGASRAMRKGDHKMTNVYFRRRLYAQSFTIAALVVGNLYWQKDRVKRKDYEKNKAAQEARDKRDRWLRELEMRDEEDKAWKERMAKRARGAAEEAKGVTRAVEEKAKELKDEVVGK
ncbi:Respiratory supercomplex factor 1, mitochondrial [Coniothyrium glycines]